MTIRINDAHSIRIVAQLAKVPYVVGHHHSIAQYDQRDVFMAGVLFTDWNGGSVQMHHALIGGYGGIRPLLWLTFNYAFEQLKVKKVLGMVPENNWRARNFDLHVGFMIEYLAEDVFNHPDGSPNGMYFMSMRRDQCRWLNIRPPTIEYAPEQMTQRVDHPLYAVPTLGSMH
jgi:hypothetical protein